MHRVYFFDVFSSDAALVQAGQSGPRQRRVRVVAKIYPKRVYLELKPGRTGAELELWSPCKEAGYFREVFGRELLPVLT